MYIARQMPRVLKDCLLPLAMPWLPQNASVNP